MLVKCEKAEEEQLRARAPQLTCFAHASTSGAPDRYKVGHKACIWCQGTPLLHLWLASCKLTCKTQNAAQLTMRCLKPCKHGLVW